MKKRRNFCIKKSSKIIVGVIIVLLIAIIGVCALMLIDNQRKYDGRINELENLISSINENNSDENNNNNLINKTSENQIWGNFLNFTKNRYS